MWLRMLSSVARPGPATLWVEAAYLAASTCKYKLPSLNLHEISWGRIHPYCPTQRKLCNLRCNNPIITAHSRWGRQNREFTSIFKD